MKKIVIYTLIAINIASFNSVHANNDKVIHEQIKTHKIKRIFYENNGFSFYSQEKKELENTLSVAVVYNATNGIVTDIFIEDIQGEEYKASTIYIKHENGPYIECSIDKPYNAGLDAFVSDSTTFLQRIQKLSPKDFFIMGATALTIPALFALKNRSVLKMALSLYHNAADVNTKIDELHQTIANLNAAHTVERQNFSTAIAQRDTLNEQLKNREAEVDGLYAGTSYLLRKLDHLTNQVQSLTTNAPRTLKYGANCMQMAHIEREVKEREKTYRALKEENEKLLQQP